MVHSEVETLNEVNKENIISVIGTVALFHTKVLM